MRDDGPARKIDASNPVLHTIQLLDLFDLYATVLGTFCSVENLVSPISPNAHIYSATVAGESHRSVLSNAHSVTRIIQGIYSASSDRRLLPFAIR
jgi:hypothetical protein